VKLFLSYFKHYLTEQLSIKALLFSVILLSALVYVEYGLNLTEKYFDPYDNKFTGFFRYFILYLIAFLPSFLIGLKSSTFKVDKKRLAQGIVMLLFGLCLYSFRSFYDEWRPWLRAFLSESSNYKFYYNTSVQLIQAVLLGLPIFVFWSFSNKSVMLSKQGLKSTYLKPYFYLLLGMVPLVGFASLNADFLETYPIYQRFLGKEFVLGFTEVWQIALFELCYGLDFFSTEFFFRGIMIIGLGRIFGPSVILPVACFYVTIHFGKPLGETISSFFGGIVLGVLAYRTESIWGGVIVHLGIAWLMELGGTFGRLI